MYYFLLIYLFILIYFYLFKLFTFSLILCIEINFF